ncbi:restriction endonuclease subunit S [Streptomyces sp. NBC_01568]|uniref:restriction endonuclease subunit S n=1 Tax=Streptomyces sp. NBC_01568 TaxID=2975882 RepID=UPI0038635F8B
MELPSGWVRATLGELGVEAQSGFASGRHNRDGHGIIHLRPMNVTRAGGLDLTDVRYISDDTGRRVVDGDVLFNNTNSPALVGKTALVKTKDPLAFSNHMTRLRPSQAVSPAFLAMQLHWLWGVGYFRTVLKNHVNQASVPAKQLLEAPVVVPPVEEQQRIVEAVEDHLSRLSAADGVLAHAKQMAALQIRSLYTAATEGRFARAFSEPVPDFRGRREEIWKKVNGKKKYKTPSAPDVSVAPIIPEGWEVLSLEELSDPIRIIRYGILMPKVKSGGTVPYVEVKDLLGCTLQGKGLHLTSKDLDEKFAGARIRPDDVVLAVRGSYDRSAVVPSSLASANVSRDVARIAPLAGLDAEFLQIYLQGRFSQQYLKRHARGVAVKGVNIAAIRAMPVVVPPLDAQRAIVEYVQQKQTAIDAANEAVTRSIRRSAALRLAILSRAFNGQLVPQSPEDEHASSVIERIRVEVDANKGTGSITRRRRQVAPPGVAQAASPSASSSAPYETAQQEFKL